MVIRNELKVAIVIAVLVFSCATIGSVSAAGNNSTYGTPLKATYHGGTSDDTMGKGTGPPGNDQGNSVAVAPDGTVYVVGSTTSNNLPVTSNAYAKTYGGSSDAFVSRYNKDLSKLLACTYFGASISSSADYGYAVAVGNDGTVYVTGSTTAVRGFPVTSGAYDTTPGGSSDVYVARFDSNLSKLLDCTLLGGTQADSGQAITVTDNYVYVTGATASPDLAAMTEYGYQTNLSTANDAFVARFDPALSTLSACTYYGGNGTDYGFGIAVDSNGKVYITGSMGSSDLNSTTGSTYNGGTSDAYVASFNPDLNTRLAFTYFGGSSAQIAYSIGIGSGDKIYISGYTSGALNSSYFNNGTYDSTLGGTYDAFVAAFNSSLNLANCTYYGGTGQEYAHDIAIGNNNDVYITGYTSSTDLPINGTYAAYDSSFNSGQDAFLACFNSNLTNLKYGTYYGGSANDQGCGLALGNNYSLILAGTTRSSNLPVNDTYIQNKTGIKPIDDSYNSGTDLFLTLWYIDTVFHAPVANFTADVTDHDAPLTVNFSDTSSNFPITWAWDFNNDGITDSTAQHPTYNYTTAGNYTVKLTVTNTAGSDYETKTNYIKVSPTQTPIADFQATMTAAGITTEVTRYQEGDTVQFTDESTHYPTSWAWDFNNDGIIDSNLQNPTWTAINGTYTVTLTVTNSNSTNSTTKLNYITVANLKIYSTALESADPNVIDAGVAGIINGTTLNGIFKAWAEHVINYSPANQTIEAGWTDPQKALHEVTGDNFNIVSLGDLTLEQLQRGEKPGSITLGFDTTIINGNGTDFVVFENGFISNSTGQIFAELGYVEVSSDNETFVRFPSISLTPNEVGGYGTVDPTGIYNLVGKHVNAYGDSWGTPFDLQNLTNTTEVLSGLVDLNNINYIRIVDIPGCGFFRDSEGRPIYDAWLTFGSGGLDLEAVGVINNVTTGGKSTATPTTGTTSLAADSNNTSTGLTNNTSDFKNANADNELQNLNPTKTQTQSNKLAGNEEVINNNITVPGTPQLNSNRSIANNNRQVKNNPARQGTANTATFTLKHDNTTTTQVDEINVPTLTADNNSNAISNWTPTATETHKRLLNDSNEANSQKSKK